MPTEKLSHAKFVHATFTPEKQTVADLQAALKRVLGMAGCLECGRIAILRVDVLGDPIREIPSLTGIAQQGFGG